MNHLRKGILLAAMSGLLCAACASTGGFSARTGGTGDAVRYGEAHAVQVALGVVRAHGTATRLGSMAIRLPRRPLSEIAAFDYRFPAECGSHHFSLYETAGTEILEYHYDAADGGTYRIRDYVSGPSPFVQPGLWSAYDHTADRLSAVRPQYASRGDGLFGGTYSKGVVADLPSAELRLLGTAYQRALGDISGCRAI